MGKDKFEAGDKEKIEAAVQEALDWLDKNQLAEKDEFEAKQKEIEGIVNPIMMKVYQKAAVALVQQWRRLTEEAKLKPKALPRCRELPDFSCVSPTCFRARLRLVSFWVNTNSVH